MRQAGILAAAGLYALEHNVGRLKEDHEKAARLADELSQVRGFGIDRDAVQTNIVIIDIEKTGKMPDDALSLLRGRGVLLSAGSYSGLRGGDTP